MVITGLALGSWWWLQEGRRGETVGSYQASARQWKLQKVTRNLKLIMWIDLSFRQWNEDFEELWGLRSIATFSGPSIGIRINRAAFLWHNVLFSSTFVPRVLRLCSCDTTFFNFFFVTIFLLKIWCFVLHIMSSISRVPVPTVQPYVCSLLGVYTIKVMLIG